MDNNNPTQIAERVQEALAQMGYCHELRPLNRIVPIGFADLLIGNDGWLRIDVDLGTLPRRVTVDKLTHSSTTRHLSSHAKHPVYALQKPSVSYYVDLRPQSARRKPALPNSVPFDQAACPQTNYLGLGTTHQGDLWIDPEGLRNILIGGSQGAGKSGFLRLLAYQMARTGWLLALADPDQVTFNADLWRGASCLVGGQVAMKPHELGNLLNLVLAELERRVQLFGNAPGYPDSLTEYNQRAAKPLPRLAVIVDEANTYLAHKDLLEMATDLSRRARKWGMNVILAGHNWRSTEIPRGLSGMLQNRLAFRVEDNTSGQVVLERSNLAETLPADTPGRCWARWEGKHILMQVYHLDKAHLIHLVERIPRSAPTTWADLAGSQEPDAGNMDDETTRILELAEQGESMSAIARQVLGSPGGNNFYKVKCVLEEHGKL